MNEKLNFKVFFLKFNKNVPIRLIFQNIWSHIYRAIANNICDRICEKGSYSLS